MNPISLLTTLDDFDKGHLLKWIEQTVAVPDWHIFHSWAAEVLSDQDTVDRYLDLGWNQLYADFLTASN